MYWDIDGQKERFSEICKLLTDYCVNNFDEKGAWLRERGEFALREQIWFSIGFFEDGRAEALRKANIILRYANYDTDCHFSPSQLLFMLAKYRKYLDADVIEKMEQLIKNRIDYYLEDENDFVGVNDNFPCLAVFTLIMGAKMFDRDDLFKKGVENLNNMKKMLIRRGFPSEYNSPTYSGVQLWGVAALAELTDNEEVRRLALDIEERIMVTQLAVFDLELCSAAGPYSRAYTVDAALHTYQSRIIMHGLIGDKLKVNLLNTAFLTADGETGEIYHCGYSEFAQISACFLLSTIYHCREELVTDLVLNKKLPMIIRGDSEHISSADYHLGENELPYEYQAAENSLYTYMNKGYSMGTSLREFHNGTQTHSFFIGYKKGDMVEKQADIGSVYARYSVNGMKPDVWANSFDDMGRKLAMQDKTTSLTLYKPKICFKDGVESLALMLIFPTMYKAVEEIWIDGRKIEKSEKIKNASTVLISDGSLYMAFYPLVLSNYGSEYAMEICFDKDYTTISFYNYQGKKRNFEAREFLEIGNGFGCQIAGKAEMSFEEFKVKAADIEITDRNRSNMHSRFTVSRITSFKTGDTELECEYSPVSEGIRYAAVNGEAIRTPKLFISGFDTEKLPFIK